MADNTTYYRFLTRGGTAANLAEVNEVPLARELVVEVDTRRMKLGDGVTRYNSLRYFGGGTREVQKINNASGVVSCRWDLYDEIRLKLSGSVVLQFNGAPPDGRSCVLTIIMGATPYGVTLPASVRYNAIASGYTPTVQANTRDMVGLVYDGTDQRYNLASIVPGIRE